MMAAASFRLSPFGCLSGYDPDPGWSQHPMLPLQHKHHVVAQVGVEPTLYFASPDSKSGMLPLHHWAIYCWRNGIRTHAFRFRV